MLIEVGQKYINAVGEVVEIISETKGLKYPFLDNSFNETYQKNGLILEGYKKDRDLICLVDDNLLKQYEDKEITQKEFIAKHIELYTGEKL